MKYIAFPIDEINAVLEICKGEVNRYSDIINGNNANDLSARLIKANWEGKVETIEEMIKFGTECDEIH